MYFNMVVASVPYTHPGLKPFDGSGFENWLYRLERLLERNAVLDMLSVDPPVVLADSKVKDNFLMKDAKAKDFIVQCVADNVLEQIKSASCEDKLAITRYVIDWVIVWSSQLDSDILRIIRRTSGKNEIYYYDFATLHHPLSHLHNRTTILYHSSQFLAHSMALLAHRGCIPYPKRNIDEVETPGEKRIKKPIPDVSAKTVDEFTRDYIHQAFFRIYHQACGPLRETHYENWDREMNMDGNDRHPALIINLGDDDDDDDDEEESSSGDVVE
uniref:DUF4219 domain-containing protein n=1 Tax=Timema douglasi TaxID=61478 RepID=A0A7R8Z9I3_TIMDO|nr:unnamed protein product [Timema douglasi]